MHHTRVLARCQPGLHQKANSLALERTIHPPNGTSCSPSLRVSVWDKLRARGSVGLRVQVDVGLRSDQRPPHPCPESPQHISHQYQSHCHRLAPGQSLSLSQRSGHDCLFPELPATRRVHLSVCGSGHPSGSDSSSFTLTSVILR